MSQPKKYELLSEKRIVYGSVLRRIRRLTDGEVGGWVEGEHNLNHSGACWVADNAAVYDRALVRDDAIVSCRANVYGQAIVRGQARVSGYGQALVTLQQLADRPALQSAEGMLQEQYASWQVPVTAAPADCSKQLPESR